LRGLKASMAPRRQQLQSSPKLEEYTFTPYFDNLSTSMSVKTTAESKAIRACVDMVIENTPSLKLKVAEIASKVEDSIALQVHDIAMSQPMYQDEVTVFTLKSEAPMFEDLEKAGLKMVTKDSIEKLVPDQATHLFVIHDPAHVQTLADIAKPQTFVLLSMEAGKTFSDMNSTFIKVAHKISKDREFVLLRKVFKLQDGYLKTLNVSVCKHIPSIA